MGFLELEKMTSPEVRRAIDDGNDTIVIPFGSLEQHGGHLPIGTDAMLGDEFGRRIADRLGAFLVPTVRVGCAEHHLAFAGTVTVSKDTLRQIAVEYACGLARHGFRRIVFVPTHGVTSSHSSRRSNSAGASKVPRLSRSLPTSHATSCEMERSASR